jgi:cytochrome P450 family 9
MGHVSDRIGEDIDVDDVMRRYTNDVIASAAFGIQVNSLKDRDNEFFSYGQNLFNFSVLQRIIFVLYLNFPPLTRVC